MIYKKYGQIFKTLREQRQLSLTDFSVIGISKSALSKFERGESMMAFDKVTSALQQLDITLEEFELFLNGSSLSESDYLLLEIEQARLCNDYNTLKEIQLLTAEKNLLPLSLSAKASYRKLSLDEIEILMDYFYDLIIPGNQELRIFCLVMDNFQVHSLLKIIDLFFEDRYKILDSPSLKNHFLDACSRAALSLIRQNFRDYSKHLMNRINSLLCSDPHNRDLTFYRTLLPILSSFWIYTFEDRNKDQNLFKNSFNTLSMIASPEIVNYYKKLCNKFHLEVTKL